MSKLIKEKQLRIGEKNNPAKKKKKITISQNWPAYNESQRVEKEFILKILDEITTFIPEEKQKRGRPRASIKDQIISLCIKEYRGLSSRRIQSDINDAKNLHYLDQAYRYSAILKFLKNKKLTKNLEYLIQLSSSPLAFIEYHVSADSTGFSTRMYTRWFNIRQMQRTTRKDFAKLHIISGAKTNIIIAARITPATEGDSPQIKKLLPKIRHFEKIEEFSADKAYNSRDNFRLLKNIGAVPYIPFRKNATGKSGGSMFYSKMYKEFVTNTEKFMERYHLRSNVETVFSMMKRKFRLELRSKTFTGQKNEILIKCLLHNLCVLCHEYHEGQINLDFKTGYKRND